MEIRQTRLTIHDVNAATRRAKDVIDRLRTRLERLTLDPERADRQAAGLCVQCYYGDGRIGGAAMTESNCRVCNTETLYGSTAVDALCERCAEVLRLCKSCGGDRDLHLRRKLDVRGIEPVAPFPEPQKPVSWAQPMLLPLRPKEGR